MLTILTEACRGNRARGAESPPCILVPGSTLLRSSRIAAIPPLPLDALANCARTKGSSIESSFGAC